jgi:hypothetical protein
VKFLLTASRHHCFRLLTVPEVITVDLTRRTPSPIKPAIATDAASLVLAASASSAAPVMVSQTTQKWILAFFMMFNGFITPGGIIYGWPGFSQLLKDEGEYAQDCENYDPKGTCGSQDNKLNNIFTVGANIATISTIVYGFTLDRFGVRTNAVSGAILMCAGFVLMGYSTSLGDHPVDAFIPGFAMVAFGGLGTYLPSLKMIDIFDRPTLILSMLSALYGLAGLTFTFFKFLAEDHGISRKTSFLAYAILTAFCALSMLLVYPKKAYKAGDIVHLPVLGWLGIQKAPSDTLDEQVVNGYGSGSDYSPLQEEDVRRPTSKLDVFPRADGASPPMPEENPAGVLLPSATEIELLKNERKVRDLTPLEKKHVLDSRSLREELFHPGTILVALHFSLGLLCSNLYNANISTVLKNMGDSDSQFANAFVFITSIYPMFFSLSIDTLQRKYRYAGTSFMSTTGLMSATTHMHTRASDTQTQAHSASMSSWY